MGVLVVLVVVGEWMSESEFSVDAADAVAVLFLFLLPLPPAKDPAVEDDDDDISDGWRSSGGRTTATSPGMREKEVPPPPPPPPPLLHVLLPLLLSSSSVNVDDTFRTKLLLAKSRALLFAPFVLVGRRSVVRPLLVVRRVSPPAAAVVSAVAAVSVVSLPSALEAEVVLADLLWRRRLVVVLVLLLPLLALALLLLLLPALADLEEALAAAAAALSCGRSRSVVGGSRAERRHRIRSSPRTEPAQGTGRSRPNTAGCFGIGEGERAVVLVTTRARFRPLDFLGVGSVAMLGISSASVGGWRHGLFIFCGTRCVMCVLSAICM